MCLINPFSCIAPQCALLYYFTLSSARQFYSVQCKTILLVNGESAGTQWVNPLSEISHTFMHKTNFNLSRGKFLVLMNLYKVFLTTVFSMQSQLH